MRLQLPTKKGTDNQQPEIEFQKLVVIGANGSGKTRFGSRIEELNPKSVHRISAQKSLTFPSEISPTSKDKAEKMFFFGSYNEGWNDSLYVSQKMSTRWNRNYNTTLLNDYDKLLALLHTEEYEESLSYKEGRSEKPITKLDRVQKIWENVLPHRKLVKRAGVIETHPSDDTNNIYNASEMSDGERVIFYLIGEVICAPNNALVIIDEPEMHIHKSLVNNLFDLVESERPDCCFLYLTHDLDFALTRHKATKIWAKSYEDNFVWDYEILALDYPIPEQLYLEVLGSRKPILFLEGDNSSIDYLLYRHIYPDFTHIPLGSCEKVIQSVKSLNENKEFHRIESFGIIDRDRRLTSDVERLISKNIWVLNVAEAENLLLLEEIVKSVARHMGKNESEVFSCVQENLFAYFTEQLETQVLLHFSEELRIAARSALSFESKNITKVIEEIDSKFSIIDKKTIYDSLKEQFSGILTDKSFNELLKIFNLKNALIPHSNICALIGIKNKEAYQDIVIELLSRDDDNARLMSDTIDQFVLKNAI